MKLTIPSVATLALTACLLGPVQGAVIYQENFDGDNTTPLNGTAPDVRPGSQVWTASTVTTIYTDGSIGATANVSAWLPYSFSANHVYTLTAIVDIGYNAGSTAVVGIGFTNNPSDTSAINIASSGDYGVLQARRNGAWSFYEGPDNNSTATASGTGLFTSSQTNYEIKLVLDTSATNWTLAGYFNGTQMDLNGAGSGLLFSYGTNPTISGVGISYASNTYHFDRFTFDAVAIPEPSSLVLLGGGLMAFLVRRRCSKVNS